MPMLANILKKSQLMKEHEIPKNETERLKVLESYQLIGLPEEKDPDFTILYL